jgi:hypothetical protein
MARKIVITILLGFFYWLLEYIVIEIFRSLNIPYSDNVGRMIYLIIPFLLGAVLIVVIKEKSYAAVGFSSLMIIVSYAISFIEITIRYPVGGNPFEETFWLFKITGIYSTLCSTLGGVAGIILTKKVLKGEKRKRDSLSYKST